MKDVLLWLLGVGGFFAVGVLLLGAASQLRDEVVNLGWVSTDSRLGRMARRAQVARTYTIFSALGLTDSDLQEIRAMRDPLPRQVRRFGEEIRNHPDRCLLRRLKNRVYRLEPPYHYKDSEYYVDMMGAIFRREDHEPSLEQIFGSWLEVLRAHGAMPAFDCIVAPKDGNPLLAAAVARAVHKPLIVVKGEEDRSRVRRPEHNLPHETDFEGLRAFVDEHRARFGATDRKLRAVVIDDCCSRGTTIGSTVERFNSFVASDRNATTYPIHEITDAVVLFRVKSTNLTNGIFDNLGLRLHALVAVGARELESIVSHELDEVIRSVDRYKDDEFACRQSRSLLSDTRSGPPRRRRALRRNDS